MCPNNVPFNAVIMTTAMSHIAAETKWQNHKNLAPDPLGLASPTGWRTSNEDFC